MLISQSCMACISHNFFSLYFKFNGNIFFCSCNIFWNILLFLLYFCLSHIWGLCDFFSIIFLAMHIHDTRSTYYHYCVIDKIIIQGFYLSASYHKDFITSFFVCLKTPCVVCSAQISTICVYISDICWRLCNWKNDKFALLLVRSLESTLSSCHVMLYFESDG